MTSLYWDGLLIVFQVLVGFHLTFRVELPTGVKTIFIPDGFFPGPYKHEAKYLPALLMCHCTTPAIYK